MRAVLAVLLLAATAGCGTAAELRFGPDLAASGWTIVEYPRIRPAIFRARDAVTLDVATDASAGMLWHTLDSGLNAARRGRWRWRADEGVKPSDLSQRGADDRILCLYFVFGLERDVGSAPMQMLASSSITAISYVYGSDKPRGTVIRSPHMRDRGKFIVLRAGDATRRTWYEETVDLALDYARLFDRTPPLLLGVAVSSDSDDTRGRNRASVANLSVER